MWSNLGVLQLNFPLNLKKSPSSWVKYKRSSDGKCMPISIKYHKYNSLDNDIEGFRHELMILLSYSVDYMLPLYIICLKISGCWFINVWNNVKMLNVKTNACITSILCGLDKQYCYLQQGFWIKQVICANMYCPLHFLRSTCINITKYGNVCLRNRLQHKSFTHSTL